MSTPQTPVIGVVRQYFNNKGFGFAEYTDPATKKPVKVFFHESNCRTVIGTADESRLTGAPVQSQVLAESQIIMRIVPGQRGMKATAWGVIPPRNWIADLIKSHALDQYVGGEIGSWKHLWGHRSYTGALMAVELTPECLTLHIASPKENYQGETHPMTEIELVLSYDLAAARQVYSHNGQCQINVTEPDGYPRKIIFLPHA